MAVSFLDLIPAPATATVKLNTRAGPIELELTGVSMADLAAIAKRFPSFAQVLDGGGGNVMENPEALAALVAAALGHAGDEQYERHVGKFPASDVMPMAAAIVRITFTQADVVPLPAAVPAAGGDGLDQTSPVRLSSLWRGATRSSASGR